MSWPISCTFFLTKTLWSKSAKTSFHAGWMNFTQKKIYLHILICWANTIYYCCSQTFVRGIKKGTQTHSTIFYFFNLFFYLLLRQRSNSFWWVIELRQAFGKVRKNCWVCSETSKKKLRESDGNDFVTHVLHSCLLITSVPGKSFCEAFGSSNILYFVFVKTKR